MRPPVLVPLFASATSLAGIGPRMQLLLKKALRLPPGVTEPRVIDLLWHTPTGVIDRRATPTVAAAVPGTIATLRGARAEAPRRRRAATAKAPYKVACEDDTGRIDLVFFHAEPKFIERQLPEGSLRYVSGRIETYNDKQADGASRLHRGAGGARRPADAGAGLSADRRPLRQGAAQGRARGAGAGAGAARMAGRGLAQGARLAGLRDRARAPAPARTSRRTSRPARRPGSGSPTTSCWPGSWRWPWCGRASSSSRGAAWWATAASAPRIADALPFALTNSQRQALKEIARGHLGAASACCGCCRATSAPARPWWR